MGGVGAKSFFGEEGGGGDEGLDMLRFIRSRSSSKEREGKEKGTREGR